MPTQAQIDRVRRESLRRAIMIVMDSARPIPPSLRLIHDVIDQTQEYGHVTMREIETHLDYLRGKGIVRFPDEDISEIPMARTAQLTPYGIDIIEGAKKMPPGIAPIPTDPEARTE